jgi:hypothetical protein
MALLHAEAADFQPALSHAKIALDNSSSRADQVEAHLLLAAIYEGLGWDADADKHFSTAAEFDSTVRYGSETVQVPVYIGPTIEWFPSTHPELTERMRRIDELTR